MITASIVTYNHNLQDIEQALHSLLKSCVSHIYLIDHSDENVQTFLSSLKQYGKAQMMQDAEIRKRCINKEISMSYHKHENIGYGGGHNIALELAKKAGSKYHIVVNPDVWFESDIIAKMKDYMDEHEEVGQMMPRVLFPDGSIQRLCKLLPTPMDMFGRLCLPPLLIKNRTKRYELRDSGYEKIMNVPCLSGCFMFFRLSAIEEIGLFDEHFFMYAEDIDMTRRMHEQYQTLFYPEVTIYHRFSRASRHSLKLLLIHITSIFKYFNKYGWFIDKQRRIINKKALSECVSC